MGGNLSTCTDQPHSTRHRTHTGCTSKRTQRSCITCTRDLTCCGNNRTRRGAFSFHFGDCGA
jgi:hypothetical protein